MSAAARSNPFVGLRPFESEESLLFFGRQEQTLELLQRLHQHQFVAVIGSSGSGKSSLIRAGLIPRLKAGFLVNHSDRWIISIMKPGQTPLCNLADALLKEIKPAKHNFSAVALEKKIKEEGVDAILDILRHSVDKHTNLFLLVDQFEELFRFSLRNKEFDKKDEAKDFVNIILGLSTQKHFPIYVVITMRSDFIGDCALIYGLPEAVNQSQYLVPRLNRLQLRKTIEGPVRLYNGKINAALTARLLNDAQTINDELPLLQHALLRIWDYEENVHKNGELDMQDYESIGGIEKALSNHADEALEGMTLEELRITKKMFQALTVDENGLKIRRPVYLNELESVTGANRGQMESIIKRFIDGNKSFLVVSNIANSDDRLIDISHESLIRQWSTLSVWVDEEAEAGKQFKRLMDSARLYKGNQRDLLGEKELSSVLDWFNTFKPNSDWAKRYVDEDVPYQYTIRYLQKSKKQQRNRKWLRRTIKVGLILFVTGIAFYYYNNYITSQNWLASNYWSSSQSARAQNDLLGSLHFSAEAVSLSNDPDLTKNLLTDEEPFLPQARLKNVFSFSDIILDAVFHPKNERIVLAGNDGSVRIIEEHTGKSIGTAMIHKAPVNSVDFSRDGEWLITASNDRTARKWYVATGKAVLNLRHPASVTSAVFSRDGKQILTACADGFARLWDADSGKQNDSLEHETPVTGAVFSPNGEQVLTTAISDSTARLWDINTKRQIVLFRHNGIVTAAAFNRDGTKILTGSHDSTVRIWDAVSKQLITTLQNKAAIKDAIFSSDDRWILTASVDGYAILWNALTGRQLGTPLKHEGPIYNVAFSPDGKRILTTGWDKAVRSWQLSVMKSVNQEEFLNLGSIAASAAFSPDGTKIITASYDSTARIWDVVSKKQITDLQHENVVTGAAFSAKGKQVLTICDDGIIRLWESNTGKKKDSLVLHRPITDVSLSADSRTIVTAGADRTVYFWNATSLKRIDSFTYQSDIKSIAPSADGKTILIAGLDSTARLLEIKSKKEIASFKHQDVVNDAVFSPNGRMILTASYDFTARLWNLATQKQIGPAMRHDAGVKSAAFSPDGKWILTASWDKTVRIWDVVTLKEIGMTMKQKEGVNSAVFSPDGTKILTTGVPGYILLVQIPGDLDIPVDLFKLQAKALTGVELNIVSGETRCIPKEKWFKLNKEYYNQASEHYKTCKYPEYNLWRCFYIKEAENIHPQTKSTH